jgi:riboflavin synthase
LFLPGGDGFGLVAFQEAREETSFSAAMFTGLVEGLGHVVRIEPDGPAIDLVIRPDETLPEREDVRLGESICINGCCLTLVRTGDGDGGMNVEAAAQSSPVAWTFQAGAETLSRTNLGRLQPGDVVNLERSLRPTDRLGGHFVQGHIDGIGEVDAIRQQGEWTDVWFRVPAALTRQMVSKGSVAVDGISLTLVNVEAERFSVALIPHTLSVTTLGRRNVGDAVNIETDVIGKYIEKMLVPQTHA